MRTPQADELHQVLTSRGIRAELGSPDEVVARGVTTQQVGEAVAAAGLVVYEMSVEQPQPRGRLPRAHRRREERIMTALVRTELLKLYWTRATWGFLAAAVVLAVVRVEMVLASVGRVGRARPPVAAS